MSRYRYLLFLFACLLGNSIVRAITNTGSIANYKQVLCMDKEDMSVVMPITEVTPATGTVNYCYVLTYQNNGVWSEPIDTIKIDQNELDFNFTPSYYPQVTLPDTFRIQRCVKQGAEAWQLSAGEAIFPVALNETEEHELIYCSNELPVQIKYTYFVNKYNQPDTYSFQYDGDEVTFYDETDWGCSKNVKYICRTTTEPKVKVEPIETVCQTDSLLDINFTVLRGKVTSYRINFNDAALIAGFKPDTADLEYSDHITIKVPAAPLSDDYKMYVQLYDKTDLLGCGTTTDTLNFSMHLGGFVFSKWDNEYSDVLFVDNKNTQALPSNGTETWHFVKYQWYKNGYAIEGADGQVYYEEFGLNGVYYVILTDENGNEYRTCSKEIRPTSQQNSSVWKVKVQNNDSKNISLTSNQSGRWTLMNNAGIEVNSGLINNGSQTINLFNQNGLFILVLRNEKAEQKAIKLFIK